jgi:hypothetical protein
LGARRDDERRPLQYIDEGLESLEVAARVPDGDASAE